MLQAQSRVIAILPRTNPFFEPLHRLGGLLQREGAVESGCDRAVVDHRRQIPQCRRVLPVDHAGQALRDEGRQDQRVEHPPEPGVPLVALLAADDDGGAAVGERAT